jgi:hypothetical protein
VAEDAQLKELVSSLGSEDWDTVARRMSGRNPRQCRERWTFYLSPAVVNGPWSSEEEALLREKYEQYGPVWTTIAAFFPTRTPISVKSRWNLMQRRATKRANSQLLAGIWNSATSLLPPSAPLPELSDPAPLTMGATLARPEATQNDYVWQPEDADGIWESVMIGDGSLPPFDSDFWI